MFASADVITIGAVKDNTLYEPESEKSNGAGEYFFVGQTDVGDRRRGVLAFDPVSAIPSGSTINSVTLQLHMSRTKAGGESVSLHRLLADWGEGGSDAAGQEGVPANAEADDATWEYRLYDDVDPSSSPAWTALGAEGDYIGAASETVTVGGNGFYSWPAASDPPSSGMAADVQGWLDVPSTSFGWIVIGHEGTNKTAKRFGSRQNGDTSRWPELIIDFTPEGNSGACCASDGTCSVVEHPGGSCSGTYLGKDFVCDPNPCPQAPGACCLPTAMATCQEETEADCGILGGRFEGALTSCAATTCPVLPTPFVDLLPLPAPAQPTTGSPGGAATYHLAMREVQQNLHSELPDTTVWGFGDGVSGAGYPGPTIEATTDEPITVHWINDLRDTAQGGEPLRTDHYLDVDLCPHGAQDNAQAVVHLHGGHVPADVDGHPDATFVPGNQVEYEYPNNQQAATLWYHDHSLGTTRLNVYMGLAGFYLVRDATEAALGLPSGEYEIPLAIQDRSFNVDGTFQYPAEWQDMYFGETMLVNGQVWPYHDVKQGKYRLRMLNGCNSRMLTLQFCPGPNELPCSPASFDVIGQEGGLLPSPETIDTITIGPGERVDLVIDFAGYSPGTAVYLVNSASAPYPGPPGEGVLPDVMKFVVGSAAGHTTPIPGALRPMEVLDEGDSVADRYLELIKGAGDVCSDFTWEVVSTDGLNGAVLGRHWNDRSEFPRLGDTEVWSFINRSGMVHPMHMHLVFFQVLDREAFTDVDFQVVPSGTRVAPPAYESGWKDTVQVNPDEIVRVIARFEDYAGLFPYHCHILEHEDHEMMRQFQTVECGNAVLEPTEECDDGNLVDGDGCSADCLVEDSLWVSGDAEGGSVDVTVDGVPLSVATVSGQTSSQVAAAIAAAIEADPTLSAAGVTAFASGDQVVTTGTIDSAESFDPGLFLSGVPLVPVLSSWIAWVAVVSLILLTAMMALGRGRADRLV
ncbi:MAG: multicopper oxidase domain-containing protein [Deltaproteobacteria bacterium]|nr:multicopper oxidase domain-containing protein [Deltaproteobacteria bacterium]